MPRLYSALTPEYCAPSREMRKSLPRRLIFRWERNESASHSTNNFGFILRHTCPVRGTHHQRRSCGTAKTDEISGRNISFARQDAKAAENASTEIPAYGKKAVRKKTSGFAAAALWVVGHGLKTHTTGGAERRAKTKLYALKEELSLCGKETPSSEAFKGCWKGTCPGWKSAAQKTRGERNDYSRRTTRTQPSCGWDDAMKTGAEGFAAGRG